MGASYHQKQLSKKQILSICNKLFVPIVLLGGEQEKHIGSYIHQKTINSKVYDFCGNLSLIESAYLIKKSHLVLTNDTGLMHIASAFKKRII